MYNEPKLCDFSEVKLSVPRSKLLRLLLKKSYLSHEEYIFLKALLWKTEAANNKILHVESIIRKALLKTTNHK